MSLTTYFADPFVDFQRFFDEAIAQRGAKEARGDESGVKGVIRPKMDVKETDDKVEATLELPGVKKDGVHINLNEGRLVISGEAKEEEEKKQGGFVVRERRYGHFSRSLPVPPGIKPEDIKAKMDNGVLRVEYPKRSQQEQQKRINVE